LFTCLTLVFVSRYRLYACTDDATDSCQANSQSFRTSDTLIGPFARYNFDTYLLTYLLTYNTYLVAEAAAAPLNTSDLLRVVFIICVDIMRLLSCTRVYMNHAVVWPEGATTLHDSLSHSLRHPEFLPPLK